MFVSLSNPQDSELKRPTLWDDGLWGFGQAGNLSLRYSAQCNIRDCCSHCKATCVVNYDFFDYFHFDLNPLNGTRNIFPQEQRGLQRFFWHVVFRETKRFFLKCKRG